MRCWALIDSGASGKRSTNFWEPSRIGAVARSRPIAALPRGGCCDWAEASVARERPAEAGRSAESSICARRGQHKSRSGREGEKTAQARCSDFFRHAPESGSDVAHGVLRRATAGRDHPYVAAPAAKRTSGLLVAG